MCDTHNHGILPQPLFHRACFRELAVHAIRLWGRFIDRATEYDEKAKEQLDNARDNWPTTTVPQKQYVIKATYFTSPPTDTLPILALDDDRDGVTMTSLSQHPLLACSRDVRIECLEGLYRHNRFHASFDLSVNKLGMSELATAIELLPTHLTRALLARNPPTLPVFEEAPKINKPKFRIFFRGFEHMTLAAFIHWTSLFNGGRLAIHIFDDFDTWQTSETGPEWNNHDIYNWELSDRLDRLSDMACHIARVLRGIQAMAIEKSPQNHPVRWSLA